MSSVALVTVASASYRDLAQQLMESATRYVRGDFSFVIRDGEEGWPVGTECRHGIFADLLEASPFEVAFLLDADMVFAEPVKIGEILPLEHGVVATLHPGYVTAPRDVLPYEQRPVSRAFVPDELRGRYYCGGFVGGTRAEILALSRAIDLMIREERADGREVTWHDESCLNRLLAETPPVLTLDPSFCHPDNDAWYVDALWGEQHYARKLVALDKVPSQRVGR
jgi:hypothetical protein